MKAFRVALRAALIEAYPADSFGYTGHPITIITSVLGLPNRRLPTEASRANQSWANIAKNFFGWHGTSFANKAARACFVTPVNIIMTPFRFSLNMIKLAIVALPLTVANLIHPDNVRLSLGDVMRPRQLPSKLLSFLIRKVVDLITKPATSPLTEIHRAYHNITTGDLTEQLSGISQLFWMLAVTALTLSLTTHLIALTTGIQMAHMLPSFATGTLAILGRCLILPLNIATAGWFSLSPLAIGTSAIFLAVAAPISKLIDRVSEYVHQTIDKNISNTTTHSPEKPAGYFSSTAAYCMGFFTRRSQSSTITAATKPTTRITPSVVSAIRQQADSERPLLSTPAMTPALM